MSKIFLYSFILKLLLCSYTQSQTPRGADSASVKNKSFSYFSYKITELPVEDAPFLKSGNGYKNIAPGITAVSNNMLASSAAYFSLVNLMSNDETKGIIKGFATDSTNGEALAYCNIYIENVRVGSSTDNYGYYIIPAVPSKILLKVTASYVGYKTKTIEVIVEPNKTLLLNFELQPSGYALQTIEKIGAKIVEKNETDVGLIRINAKDLESIPKGVETDIFRSLQHLPGVKSSGDVSARYYVRGSSSNQNLVLLDGGTIYNPFHALGLFSVIDPEIINSVQFYKGGFTAEHGGRLSSVISINSKDGNKKNISATSSASLLTGKVFLEGPVPDGSFFVSGRKSYSNRILKKFLNNESVPIDFYDFGFKLNYSSPSFVEGGKFIIHGIFSNDNIIYNDSLKADYNWKNNVFGFKWFQVGDSPLFYEVSLYYSSFEGNSIQNKSRTRPQLNIVNDLTLQMNFSYIFEDKNEINIGFHIKDIKTNLYVENQRGAITDFGKKSSNISVFGKYKFLSFDNFGLDLGTRLNLATLTSGGGKYNLEPRISLTYRPINEIAVKAAWGIYVQELTTLTNESEVISLFEPWVINPEYLKPTSSIQYSGGITFDLSDNFKIDTEAYYKKIYDLPKLNEEKVYSNDRDFISGSGESYGFEFMSQFNPGIIKLTAAYTLAWAYQEINEKRFYPKYDARHSLSLSFEINIESGWSSSLVWSYSKGLPFTQISGFYDKLYIENLDGTGIIKPFNILDDRNAARLPDYHRLDFTLSKRFDLDFIQGEISLNILNVYNRKNIFYFEKITGNRVNSLPFLPTATIKIKI